MQERRDLRRLRQHVRNLHGVVSIVSMSDGILHHGILYALSNDMVRYNSPLSWNSCDPVHRKPSVHTRPSDLDTSDYRIQTPRP
jgi:hypothetical protein